MKRSTAPFLNCLLAIGFVLVSWAARAQPSTGGPAPTTTDPTAVPIDGGASLLLAGGVAYGLRRLQRKRAAR
ncbi:MAG: PID-CTERM protein-sorting domain-containing protein [Janthinobacterium lividum]